MTTTNNNWKIDPTTSGREDCETAVAEGSDPSDLTGPGADDGLISAMGVLWVLDAAGVATDALVDAQAEGAAWQTYGLPWCAEYARAYADRARELASES